MAIHQLHRKQQLNTSLEEAWSFISSPANLKLITPDYMGFEIKSPHLPDEMYPGMMISYKVSPLLGIDMTWVTEITQVKNHQFFVDEQRVGPYKLWHHEHHIEPNDDGVMMTDLLTYQLHLGIMGDVMNRVLVRRKIDEIFDYRQRKLNQLFR